MEKDKSGRLLRWGLVIALTFPLCGVAAAQSVSLPNGMNLGGTTFYDGFGGGPGDGAFQVYLNHSRNRGLKDADGNDVSFVNDAELDVSTLLTQWNYNFDVDWTFLGGHLGLDVLLPIVNLDTDFSDPPPFPGLDLVDNKLGLGDASVLLTVQYDPLLVGGQPAFVSRVGAGFMLPTGQYDAFKDINQGNNHTTFTAYWAMTALLDPQWSISLRPSYYYSFENDDPATSLDLPVRADTSQPGQALALNYNVGYRVNETVTLGVSGYYLAQLTEDRLDGRKLEDSTEQAFAIGPSAMFDIDKANKLFVTAYTETAVENRFATETFVQLRWLHTY